MASAAVLGVLVGLGAVAPASALADTVTITGSNLGNLAFSHVDAGTSAGTVGSGASTQVVLSSANDVGPSGVASNDKYLPVLADTAEVSIANGLVIGGKKVQLGSLSDLVTQGAQGNVGYDVIRGGTNPDSYFRVLLTNPNTPTDSVLINAYGGGLGANNFNQGVNTQSFVAAITTGGTTTYDSVYTGAPIYALNTPGFAAPETPGPMSSKRPWTGSSSPTGTSSR